MADMVRFVEVQGWQIAVEGVGDEEEKVRDVDLAERLGYGRPRDVRKLIERLQNEGKLGEVACRDTVARQRTGFGEREFGLREYWLNEAQALKIVAKSETELADKILDQVIRVFIAVRRGRVSAPSHNAAVEELKARTEHLRVMRPYYEDGLTHLEELVIHKLIEPQTAVAHRIELLRAIAGIDLTKAPALRFESASLVTVSSVSEAPASLPVTGMHAVPVVDMSGFHTAKDIAEQAGVSVPTVSAMAKAVRIYRWKTVDNKFGMFVPLVQNGKVIKENWSYSAQARKILLPLLEEFRKLRKESPRKVRNEAIIADIGSRWIFSQEESSPFSE